MCICTYSDAKFRPLMPPPLRGSAPWPPFKLIIKECLYIVSDDRKKCLSSPCPCSRSRFPHPCSYSVPLVAGRYCMKMLPVPVPVPSRSRALELSNDLADLYVLADYMSCAPAASSCKNTLYLCESSPCPCL
ncbi:hypothetical protein FIBSPDRAFT_549518 [Athelia psychrophila]|uniref:Uncharacterized protein n=1 Tax=Athelia psychrophila TaxID=1759441 RepID=A0A166URZ2_9AGAM|nr:hypothetical protein FIBSPDRAFT_549518 [Fibularhizoctonia sp. CBS 109695]